MGESLVAFRHPVGFFFSLDGAARVLRGVEELERQLLGHALTATLAGKTHDPTTRQGEPAIRPDLDRDLVGGAADAPRLDLEQRGRVTERGVANFERLLLRLPAGARQRAVHDL